MDEAIKGLNREKEIITKGILDDLSASIILKPRLREIDAEIRFLLASLPAVRKPE